MSKRMFFITASIVTAVFCSTFFLNFNSNANDGTKINPAFAGYISAFTSGLISNQSSIRIELANEVTDSALAMQIINQNVFSFSPTIKGTTQWIDSRTIEFKPESKLSSGEQYRAIFRLSKIMDVPSDLENFDFSFRVIKQEMEVDILGMTTIDKQKLIWNRINGTITTADFAETELLQKTISAKQNGKSLRISWTHEPATKISYFTIDSVQRAKTASEVLIEWSATAIGSTQNDQRKFSIPALGDFKIMNVRVVQSPDQYISIMYSDPLDEKQNIKGLIQLTSQKDPSPYNLFTYDIVDNEIKAYPNTNQIGEKSLIVEQGVKNILGYSYKNKETYQVNFEALKPQIKLMGKGVILPNSEGLIFPFQCVSLNAVDVKIVKIYENNVMQFLQVNKLDGNREMRRVGRMILNKKIDLKATSELEYTKWNTYSLDLAELIKTEPGAVYRVSISFKKSYSTYACSDSGKENNEMEKVVDNSNANNSDDEPSDYYYDDYYYYDYEYDYNYSERDDPCSNSYYKNVEVTRNVLASDLGIIAKHSQNNTMTFAVSDLKTTQPLSGVTLELYNYQQQLVSTCKTDGNGLVSIEMNKKPFLLIAKSGKQRGYLKLDDGSSLSLSMFDVAGDQIQKGLKGFIYGERGVWRPGDSLYLMFVLEDKLKTLPVNHPVSFELTNPQGQLVKRMTTSSGLNGFYNFSTCTDVNAPTGDYTATVRVGGASFSKNIKIETIVPNRLKLNLDFGVDKIIVDKKIKGDLKAKWLHGAIAKNLDAKVEVSLNKLATAFKGYDDFVFDDPARSFYTETQTIFDGKLNENGTASVEPNINIKDAAPGMLKASFVVRVFEQGGGFSIDRFSLPYSPFNSYVGIKVPKGTGWGNMLFTDTNNIVQIATVDANGKPVSKKKLTVQVYKVNWRWWWDSYEDELANYLGGNYHMPIQTEEISTTNGKGKFVLRINRPDWGRYLVRVTDAESGHSTGQTVYIDWPYWAGKSDKGDDKGATMLSFNADKPKYNVGDDINLTVPSSGEGRALISIENGSKVISAFWVQTQQGETKYTFKATPEMTPNVYVNVTLIQPHAQTKNDLPIRMYGVIPLLIDDPKTHLYPELVTADVWKPEQTASLTVSEKNGNPMTYSIAIVDEGLLDLTRFKTPDPWSHFYAREALGVKTWDMYDMVLGAYGGKLQRILAIGGDGEINNDAGKKANRFKPMVRFIGPFYLGKGEKVTHKVNIPQYVGSVRVMVVTGQNFAYGNNEKTVAVRTPLMLLGTMPRVVGPNETLELPVNVFAMEKNIKNVTVQVTPNNLFVLEDAPSKQITFKEVGDEVVNFKLKVKPLLGIGKIKITAICGNEKATYDIEIDVRNPNPKVTDVIETVIEPNQTWTTEYKPNGMMGTNKGTIEVSSIPPIDLERRLRYLIQYPHGCIEQTTSSVFPQLFVADFMEIPTTMKTTIENNIKAGINRIKSFQLSSGGFSYWPGYSDEASSWGTNYAGHFLIEAQKKGYSVPQNLLDNFKRYQKQTANNWTSKPTSSYYYYYNDDLEQAYRLYTLALMGAPELGAMNRLRENPYLSNVAKWRLAAAYQIAGYAADAKKLALNTPTTVKEYTEFSYSYGSDERDEAMIIETLVLMGEKGKAAPLVKELSKELSRTDGWMSTQTTAYALIAVSKFVGDNKGNKDMNFSYTINNSTQTKTTKAPVSQINMDIKNTNSGNVKITNNGSGILYARIILEGIPEQGDNTSSESGIKMTVAYYTMNGTEIEPDKIKQGTDFYAMVKLTNNGTRGFYKEMALTQIFPSGWEIRNTRMDEAETNVQSSDATYQDFRDDRVYTYYNLPQNQTKTYKIMLNAAFLGRFYLPTVYTEAMYDNTINARQPGKWVEVVKEFEVN